MSDTFVKPPFYQSAKYLNDVNDATLGGALTVGGSTLTVGSQAQQNVPGDRIILDDVSANLLSDTTVGTLYGGIYMYVQCVKTTQSAAVGGIAFMKPGDVGATGGLVKNYISYTDAQPSTTVPTFVLGVYINALTASNWGWIQIAGVASVLFDSSVSQTTSGSTVIAKASATVASTADNLTATTTITAALAAAIIGVSLVQVTTSTAAKVAITRGLSRI